MALCDGGLSSNIFLVCIEWLEQRYTTDSIGDPYYHGCPTFKFKGNSASRSSASASDVRVSWVPLEDIVEPVQMVHLCIVKKRLERYEGNVPTRASCG